MRANDRTHDQSKDDPNNPLDDLLTDAELRAESRKATPVVSRKAKPLAKSRDANERSTEASETVERRFYKSIPISVFAIAGIFLLTIGMMIGQRSGHQREKEPMAAQPDMKVDESSGESKKSKSPNLAEVERVERKVEIPKLSKPELPAQPEPSAVLKVIGVGDPVFIQKQGDEPRKHDTQKEPAELPQRKPNPNFIRDDVATITTQKQLDSLKITEKQRQNVILELIDSQKFVAEKNIQDSKMAGPLLERIPKTNVGDKRTIKAGKWKGYQETIPVPDKYKNLADRNHPDRRKLDFDVMIFTRDDQYSIKGDFVAMRAAIIKKQKNLIDVANAYATGRMFCYPVKLPPVSYSGQVCSLVEGVEFVSLNPEVKLDGVVTVKVNHTSPGKPPLKQYYHLIGWPEGKLQPRANRGSIEPAYPHVDPSAIVLVGDIVNINGKQGIALSYALSLDDAERITKSTIQQEVKEAAEVPRPKE